MTESQLHGIDVAEMLLDLLRLTECLNRRVLVSYIVNKHDDQSSFLLTFDGELLVAKCRRLFRL